MKKISKKLKKIRFILEYIAVMPVYLFVRLLPLKGVHILANIIGTVFYYIYPKAKKLITANLSIAFPEKTPAELKKIAKKNCRNTILMLLEFFWFINRHDKLLKRLTMDPKIEKALKKCNDEKRGVIWVTPHIGNWEVARIAQTSLDAIKMAVVARPLNNPHLDKLFNYGREADGSTVIPSKGAVKGMINAMKNGLLIATLIDQNTRARDGGMFVDFFGLPVCTSRAPAMFGRKFNAYLAVGGAVRKPGCRYETFLKLLPKEAGDYSSDEELIADLMKLTEEVIREYPDQYLWLYERWCYIPETCPEEKKKKYPYYSKEVTPRFYSAKVPRGVTFEDLKKEKEKNEDISGNRKSS
jgi:KDO2-lipid IV(A) lauroyltransferase